MVKYPDKAPAKTALFSFVLIPLAKMETLRKSTTGGKNKDGSDYDYVTDNSGKITNIYVED